MNNPRPGQLLSIQYLRAFAALLVVGFHAGAQDAWLYNPLRNFSSGRHGVDVFFVISGFVMYTAARQERAPIFYARRLVRIVPMYWIATIVFVGVHLATTNAGFSRFNLLRSLLFIPFHNPAFDGQIWPLLVPGWTLNYEMLFYALFGIGIVIRRPLALISFALPVLVILGSLAPSANALWQIYTNPLLLEFLGGMVLAKLFDRHGLGRFTLLLPLGIVGLLASDLLPLPQVISAGLPALGIVTGALSLDRRGHFRLSPLAKHLGDASYAIYLVHVTMIELLALAWQRTHLTGMVQLISFLIASLLSSCGVGLVVHRYVERPILRCCNAWIRRYVETAGPVPASGVRLQQLPLDAIGDLDPIERRS